jgi:hypothetical protein
MRIIWEDTMRSKCTHTLCSSSTQHTGCLSNSSSSLDQIIDDDNIFSFWIAFFDGDLTLVSLSTHLDTDDTISMFWEALTKPLRSTIIRECDDSIGVK